MKKLILLFLVLAGFVSAQQQLYTVKVPQLFNYSGSNPQYIDRYVNPVSGQLGIWGFGTDTVPVRWALGSALTVSNGTLNVSGSAFGNVVGPASSTNNEVVLFSGLTGKIIKQADGPITLTAGGTDQNITLTPSGVGGSVFSSSIGAYPTGLTPAAAQASGTIGVAAVGFAPTFFGTRVNGSFASPTAVTSGQTLFNFLAGGATGAATYQSSGAGISLQATENWSGSANGSRIVLLTAANGQSGNTTSLTVSGGNATTLTGGSGDFTLAAGGTNQNIQLDASGTGYVGVKPSGLMFGSVTSLGAQASGQLALNYVGGTTPALILQENGTNSGYFSTNAGAARLNGQASLALTVDDTGGRIDIGPANGNISITPNGTGVTFLGGVLANNPPAPTNYFANVNRGLAVSFVGSTPSIAGVRAQNTIGSPQAVGANNTVLAISGMGYDGASYQTGGSINIRPMETWSASARGTFIEFNTTASAGTSLLERWRIDQDGGLKAPSINTAGLQLYNTADQTTNYERLGLRWSGNVAIIESTAAGSGTNRPLSIFTGGVAALTIDTSQNSVFSGSVLSRISVNLKTQAVSPYTVLATESGRLFSNEGSTAQVIFNLPTPAVGLRYTFIVQDTDGIRVQASTGTRIRIAGQLSAVSGNVEATASGDTVTLVAINALEWMSIATNGTWTAN